MKVSFICPARNKAAHVGFCVRSMLEQTYAGNDWEVVVSVQHSEDDTLGEAMRAVEGYSGPASVRVIVCPNGERRGMAGLNDHLAWIHTQIGGEVVINCSADDYNEPQRVERTIEAWDRHRPSYIGTRVIYENPDGSVCGETNFPGRCSRHLAMTETINHLIGSSASSAWARDLWQKYGPLSGVEAQDMLLPIMAFFERGVYYVDEPLHHHVFHAGLDNTGTEGQMRAARDEIESARLGEVNGFQLTHHWTSVYRRIAANGFLPRMPQDSHGALFEKIINAADYWVHQRAELTMRRIEPVGYRV